MNKIIEKSQYTATIIGINVSITNMAGVLTILGKKWSSGSNSKPFFVVTAYSEFFLEAQSNPEFAKAIKEADLVVADGAVVPAAADYLSRKSRNSWRNFWLGLETGIKLWKGKYPERVAGVDLVKQLGKSDPEVKRIFLLGGRNGVAGRLAGIMQTNNPKLTVGWDEGPKDVSGKLDGAGNKLIDRINKFAPDVLFVAFGRYKQEIWIARNKDKLNTRMVMGVGSAFDELTGEGMWAKPIPEWVNRHGLKWLWRAVNDTKHWPRVWRAVVVFPWKVFRSVN